MAITTNGGAGITADAVATLSNKTLEQPVINNATFTGAQAGLEIKFGNNIVLEGTTANDFETTITAGDPTADRTITLPDVTGTVVTTGNLTAITTVTSATLTSPTITGAVFNDGSVVFEGATANDFETTIQVTDPTADRTITFQDATGTVVLRDSTDTLTNKTLTSPTVGTQASFDNQAEARFLEATANGTNYVGFKAPASITSNLVWVLPSADGSANHVLQTNGSGTLSFAAASSGVSANDQAFAFAVQVFA